MNDFARPRKHAPHPLTRLTSPWTPGTLSKGAGRQALLTAAASRGALGGRDRKAYSTWYSQAVSHPSTNQARHCLASEIGRDRACSVWYGRKPLLPDKVGLIKLTCLGTCRQTGRQTESTLIAQGTQGSHTGTQGLRQSAKCLSPSFKGGRSCLSYVLSYLASIYNQMTIYIYSRTQAPKQRSHK